MNAPELLLLLRRYGFNAGSALTISAPVAQEVVARAAVATTLAASAAGLTSVLWSKLHSGIYDLFTICNGILAGLVAITAGCAVVAPWAALVIGVLGSMVFHMMESYILVVLKIDDPLAASAMHGCVGATGAILLAFFAAPEYLAQQLAVTLEIDVATGVNGEGASEYGRRYRGILYGGDGRLLAAQLVGACASHRVNSWTAHA